MPKRGCHEAHSVRSERCAAKAMLMVVLWLMTTQTEESRRIAGARVIEPITVATLHEAVRRLTEQANMTNQPVRQPVAEVESVDGTAHRGSA
jgi:hypothetical protein